MGTAFPQDCRSTIAFVVSVIRKVETEAGRPQGYRWDGRSWSEPKAVRKAAERAAHHDAVTQAQSVPLP